MSKWIWKLADNGWADWICPKCGWKYNDDIHVTLDYKYCPMCGEYLGETPKEQPKSATEILDECGISHSNDTEWDDGKSLAELRSEFFTYLNNELSEGD